MFKKQEEQISNLIAQGSKEIIGTLVMENEDTIKTSLTGNRYPVLQN